MSNLSKLLARGGALARQGDIAGARAEFEKAARDHARSAEPWISLSAVHGMQGNFAEALRCAQKAVELAPNSLQGWVNLGNAAQSQGELTQAAEAFQRASGLPGCPPDIVLQLGVTLAQLGRWVEADEPLRNYLSRYPDHRDATLTLSKTLAMAGNLEAAARITEDYCNRHRSDTQALSRLGAIYLDLGRNDDAWRICEQTAMQSPDSFDALFFKASLLSYEGRYADARDLLERLERMQPGNLQVLDLLSRVSAPAGDDEGSIAYARAALKLDRRNTAALKTLSMVLLYRDTVEARKLMEEALAIAPDDLSVLELKARVLEVEGDKQGAWNCAQHVIAKKGMNTAAAVVIANVAPEIGKTQEAIEHVERFVAQPGLSSTNQRLLRFTLVGLCDKAKQYDRAFGHAVIANQLRKLKSAPFDPGVVARNMNRLASVYSRTAMDSLPRSTNHSDLPLFIVGMPRSGTSLLEQILSCHTKVYARGETTDIGKLAESIPYYPDGVRNLTQEKLDTMAAAYLERLSDMAPSATRVTDKLPGNYMYLGFISQLFPGARVLHCLRDPRDVCLSNYFTEFHIGHDYACDLEYLAQFYKAYRELMEHWKTVLPLPVLDVRYEELVAKPREWVDKILAFCGLDWEDACLDFHKSKRQVATASYDQVRNPLYKSSVARWKNYERYLEPVSRILSLRGDTYA
jgi:tetratricopeptide (TPR) repeat protein